MNRHFVIFACFVVLTSTVGHAQDVLDFQLFPFNVEGFSTSLLPNPLSVSTAQCPAVGPPSFTYDVVSTVDPVNDDIAFQGVLGQRVADIAHLRVTFTLTYAATGNKVIARQDWTRIKENPNGIDNVTGIRNYIGLYEQESQQPTGKEPVVTATTEGVMTLQEPLSIKTGPLAGRANRVAATSFIGPQPAWLEPFVVNDTRICSFLATGVVEPVDPKYNSTCVADGTTTYVYNHVRFTGNIVSCP
jgi:hypothetical protein